MRECNCGSGEDKYPVSDARGIFVFYACDTCIKEKKKGYRLDIFEDCNYETYEQIDEDY